MHGRLHRPSAFLYYSPHRTHFYNPHKNVPTAIRPWPLTFQNWMTGYYSDIGNLPTQIWLKSIKYFLSYFENRLTDEGNHNSPASALRAWITKYCHLFPRYKSLRMLCAHAEDHFQNSTEYSFLKVYMYNQWRNQVEWPVLCWAAKGGPLTCTHTHVKPSAWACPIKPSLTGFPFMTHRMTQ
jgi:hypothetical protein